MNDSALSAQQRKAVRRLHAVADELQEMSARTGQSPVGEATKQAAQRVRSAASWLEQREPADAARDARDFARRHPGTVLAGAAVVGLAARRRPGLFLAGAVAAALAVGRRSQSATRREQQSPAEPLTAEPASAIPAPPDPDWTPVPGQPDAPSAPAGSAPYYPASGVAGPGAAGPAGPQSHGPEPHQSEEQS